MVTALGDPVPAWTKNSSPGRSEVLATNCWDGVESMLLGRPSASSTEAPPWVTAIPAGAASLDWPV